MWDNNPPSQGELPNRAEEKHTMMLNGAYDHTLDDKGRVSLPAKHRGEMGDTLILLPGLDGQINVYPLMAWQKAAENVAAQNQALKEARDLTRILYAAIECQVDRQGRILIPPSLRTRAQLDTNVVILGVHDHLEIWSQERWQEVLKRLDSEGSQFAEKLAGLGLRM
jgi:transcriptional regulator MraZ